MTDSTPAGPCAHCLHIAEDLKARCCRCRVVLTFEEWLSQPVALPMG
jgi:hypothetical protein